MPRLFISSFQAIGGFYFLPSGGRCLIFGQNARPMSTMRRPLRKPCYQQLQNASNTGGLSIITTCARTRWNEEMCLSARTAAFHRDHSAGRRHAYSRRRQNEDVYSLPLLAKKPATPA
jgi:hypothetical protein